MVARRLARLAFCLALTGAAARASVTGSISGVVSDPSGAVIPQVKVIVVNTQTGIAETTAANSSGFYAFPSLAVGQYELTFEKSGFEIFRQSGLVVDVNTALRVDATLKVGVVSQEVTVSSAAVHVETNTQMGEVIGSTDMTALPLNGRSYTDLLALQPGVVPVLSGEGGSPNPSGDLNPGNLSVSGQRESANGFMVNGGNVEEGMWMGTAIIPVSLARISPALNVARPPAREFVPMSESNKECFQGMKVPPW